ncbi:MAG: TIGR03960 family B12-binding radical SAM protein, partial [Oscillospiraceae bacterium]|nr:TIGR03960 family B12-binding radical SAM protein [Oscillospiraceae bacterium]
MTELLQRILPTVQKPARYTGGEFNEIKKDPADVRVRVAFCFPDTYEIGMSNVGMRILYGVMNEMDGVWCERVFAPWGDMEEAMRKHRLPLWALESQDPVKDFDMIAFTIGYEMCYTNIVNMLDLAGVPLYAKDRKGLHNMVFAGGVCTFNPEPLADFFDFFSLGEGEESTVEIVSLYDRAKAENWTREQFLQEVSRIPGVYVPSFYAHSYNPDGTLAAITPLNGAPAKITKRIIEDLDHAYYPTKMIVPSTEIVHDRANLEVFRGCLRGCRFCQAGFSCRPVRKKSAEVLYRQAVETLEDSGHNEITLSSLSTSDYKELKELTDAMIPYCAETKVNLSVPSLRADNFSRELMQRLKSLRKSGLTFAPEAGTQRLRDVINKNLTEEEILEACTNAFSGGWNNVKLYFMLGLPTETDEDVLGIAELVYKIIQLWKEHSPNKKRGLRVHVATAFFVPKPHTPFQWEKQISPEEY